jgi:hypothetical protein
MSGMKANQYAILPSFSASIFYLLLFLYLHSTSWNTKAYQSNSEAEAATVDTTKTFSKSNAD